MAVAFVRAASGTATEFTNTVTVSFDATGCDYLHISVSTVNNANTVDSPPDCTYNGVACTLVQASAVSPNSLARVWTFGRTGPTSGTHDCDVTWTGSQAGDRVGLAVAGYSGVDQATPTGTPATATLLSATASVDVGSASGELVVDSVGTSTDSGTPLTADSGQTERADQVIPSGLSGRVGSSEEAGAGTVTMSWTVPFSDWAINAVSLKGAAGGTINDDPWISNLLTPRPADVVTVVFS